jgi:membrane carboxypeptidase/penicillin-binding protein
MGFGITGTRGAIPIWAPVMRSLHRDLPEKRFEYSDGLETREICPVSHGLSGLYCPNPYDEMFLVGVLPENCHIHSTTASRDTSNVLDFFGTQQPSKSPGGSGGLIF